MEETTAPNYRITLLLPCPKPAKMIQVLRKHEQLSFAQAMAMQKSTQPYTLPHAYAAEYAAQIAREFDNVGTGVRVTSDAGNDVTTRFLGVRTAPPPARTGVVTPLGAKRFLKVLAVAVSVLIVVVVILAIALPTPTKSNSAVEAPTPSDPTKNTPQATSATAVTATKLAADYEQNEIAADSKYKDKQLQISGTVESINKDFADDPYLVLVGTNMFLGVHAELRSGESGTAASLSKGSRVTLSCKGAGYVVGAPVLKECSFQ